MRRIDSLHLQLVVARKRRNLDALPAARFEFPPVIAALQVLPVKMPVRKWNPTVRTSVPHRKRLPSVVRPSTSGTSNNIAFARFFP